MPCNSQMGFKLSSVLCLSMVFCCCSLQWGEATVTHPQEVAALKIIAKKMKYGIWIWDFSQDPCSGGKSWNLNKTKGNETFVSCNCGIPGEKFCRVTHILLKRQDLSGVIPPEFVNLTF
ncbi:probable LRR receptor-like serine/threonine-protein kinase At1g07650 [Cryptomeria japonica]|uniref:probable LRR receptor-like serine/threonine-protein kinase At1g07650 n=1 Tax=Cryptomeria japonica TaxID=3369 RepID=UPI0027D9D3CF|nr:probable LRR receptor-like serine/threonine-protein kinase At1g07650 [Cryptomeria japonica]